MSDFAALTARVAALESLMERNGFALTASREPDADNFLDGVVAASRSKRTGGIADVEALAQAVEAAIVGPHGRPLFTDAVGTVRESDAIPRAAVEALADEIKFGRVRFQEEIVERLMALARPEVQR